MDALIQDVRYAWRALRRAPGLAVLAALCMALGIGSVTTVYGTASAFTFRPLPQVRGADRLLHVWESPIKAPQRYEGVSPAAFRDLATVRSFSAVAAARYWQPNIEGADLSERVTAAQVSANMLRALGRKPILGRDFTAADDQAGVERVILLGYGLWLRRFGGDSTIVGHSVRINGDPYTVVGILPQDFMFPAGAQLLTPLAYTTAEAAERRARSALVLARLRDGVTEEQAAAEVSMLGARLATTYPEASADWSFRVEDAESFFGSGPRPFMIVLLASAAFVLLIACANAANLLLVRATGRRREIAVRLALGASPLRIVRETLAESLIISALGGALGCVMAVWGLGALGGSVPVEVQAYIPGFGQLQLDWRALVLTSVVAMASGLLFGMAPAFTAARADVQSALRDGGRGETGTGSTRHLRNALVVVEVALALQLIVGATLMVDTFRRIALSDPGFRTTGVLTLGVTLPEKDYPSDSVVVTYFDNLEKRVAALPGVEAAGVTTVLPMTWTDQRTAVEVEGQPLLRKEDAVSIGLRQVSASYAEALRIPLVRGRVLSAFDREDATPVALLSESAAKRLWPGQSAVGKRLRTRALDGDAGRWIEVVGVVADVRGNPLATRDPGPVLYVPARQWPARSMTLVVRAGGDPEALMPGIRREIAALDSRLAAGEVATMPRVVASATSPQSATAGMLAVAAIVALLMSAAGTYGVVAYGVAQRTREFGVRIALGAAPADIVRLVLRQSATLAVAGVVLGVGGALLLSRGMQEILYETDPRNPAVIGAVALALGLITLMAAWIPARRVVRISPLEALRAD
ncbi:MAG TPA: ABC transporter permease [Gemmatimonadaceae bacterium]|jgi:putative ABC transport system permease protein